VDEAAKGLDTAANPGELKFWPFGLADRARMDHTIDLIGAEKGVLPKIAAAHGQEDQWCI